MATPRKNVFEEGKWDMKILILTLCGQRDKVVDEYIAEHLRQYGHKVHVHNYAKSGFQSVIYAKPDVVISPFPGAEFKLELLKRCKEWGCEVIIRRGEAGVSKATFEKMNDEQRTIILGSWDYSPYVDLELVWGGEFADILAKKGHISKDRLRPCGAFAFDAYFRRENERNRNHKKTALFATAWSTADSQKEYCECGLPEDSSYHEVIYEAHRAGRDLWIQTIRDLVRRLGHTWQFRLKVRPGEQVVEYCEKLGDVVTILPQARSSVQALRDTDLLIHAGSTMAIEAHLMKIPALNFHNANPDPVLAQISPRVETYEELEYHFKTVNLDISNINDDVLKELTHTLYNGEIDGKACMRAAEYIQEHLVVGKSIKTNIPDEWPREVRFPSKGVHSKARQSSLMWVCPICKMTYYTSKNRKQRVTCLYCGAVVKRLLGQKTTTVAK